MILLYIIKLFFEEPMGIQYHFFVIEEFVYFNNTKKKKISFTNLYKLNEKNNIQDLDESQYFF